VGVLKPFFLVRQIGFSPVVNTRGRSVNTIVEPIHVDIYTHSTCDRTGPVNVVLAEAARRFPLEVKVFDISHDPVLEVAYGTDTPVVLIEGAERFRREINEHELQIILQTISMRKMQQHRRDRQRQPGP
jgi:hypothetical protein